MSLRVWGGEPALVVGEGVDPRAWIVRTLIDDTEVGTVHDLLVDPFDLPRYLDVALAAHGKHVLVPIGYARADSVHSFVWVPGFAAHQFELIPSYSHQAPSRGDEARLLNAYSASMAGAMPRRGYRVFSARRTRRPAATDPRRLVPISRNPDLRIVSGKADPRGWSVIDRRGIVRGAVHDLLVDLAALKVRYVVCGLAAETEEGTTRWVLIPVEFLRLEPGASVVLLPTFSAALVAALPAYASAPPDAATEAAILERFAEAQEADDFYSHPRFDAAAFFDSA
jgi:PRC-barrel domain protein